MTLAPHFEQQIKEFLTFVAEVHGENKNDQTFSYIAVKKDEEFVIVKGVISYNTGFVRTPLTHFHSENVRAGAYSVKELNLEVPALINAFVSGQLTTPHGVLRFLPNDSGNYATTREPFHQEGIKAQSRLDVLTVLGGPVEQYLQHKLKLDWELRAASTPYDTLEELAFEYGLGTLRSLLCVEVIAFNVVAFDFRSTISGTKAKLGILLARGLSRKDVSLGYRLFDQGRVRARSVLKGCEMQWTETEEHQLGEIEIEVSNAAVLNCFASYRGIAQHFGWASDPSLAQNSKRVAHSVFDRDLTILKQFIFKVGGKGSNSRDLETGIAWLLWMLGFSVSHFGATNLTQDGADLIVTIPSGHFAVVECTTGLLKAENKLALLVQRAEQLKEALVASSNGHLRVLPVIVSSKTRAELSADLEQAEKLGVLVISRENIERTIERTLVLPNADQLYEEALKKVEADREKFLERSVV
jgi:hypothetical protein